MAILLGSLTSFLPILRHSTRSSDAQAVRRAARRAKTPFELVDLILGDGGGRLDLHPEHSRSELIQLAQDVAALRPSTVLHIGIGKGGTFFLFSQLAQPHAKVIGVTIAERQSRYPPTQANLLRRLAPKTQDLAILAGDPTDIEMYAEIQRRLKKARVDLLFIDGDFSYDGVETNFRYYSLLVRTGGLIALNKIKAGPPAVVGQAPQFWEDLKRSGRVAGEFVDYSAGSWDNGPGIGVIRSFEGFRIPRRRQPVAAL